MRNNLLWAPLLALACGGGDKAKSDVAEPTPPTSPTVPADVPTTVIADPDWPTAPKGGGTAESNSNGPQDGELRFFEDGRLRVVLKADGALVLVHENRRVAGKLSPDNVFTGDDGAVIAMDKEGYIEVAGEESGYRVSADGALRGPKIDRIGLAVDGAVTGQSEEAKPIRVEGATSDALRRRALFVLALLLLR